MKFCQSCGRQEMNDQAAFCLNCGAKFSDAPAGSQPVTEANRIVIAPAMKPVTARQPRAKGLPITGFIFSVIAAVWMGYFAFLMWVIDKGNFDSDSLEVYTVICFIPFILGLLGMIFCAVSAGKSEGAIHALSIVGLILGIITTVVFILVVVSCVGTYRRTGYYNHYRY